MTSFDKLFGPLTKDYCKYFLALSVLGFIFMVFSMVSLIIVVLMNGKKQNYGILLNMLVLVAGNYLTYVSNRLLYTMCNKL